MSTVKLLMLSGSPLEPIQGDCLALCQQLGIELDFQQINGKHYDALIVSPAGYSANETEKLCTIITSFTHLKRPVIEVHPTNIYQADSAISRPLQVTEGEMGFISGLGVNAYILAIKTIDKKLNKRQLPERRYDSSIKASVINGPNLNLLGTREPEIYGYDTLEDISRRCQDLSLVMGVEVEFMQSNHEGTLVDWIQQAINKIDAIIINAGAYTHTSVAIHDALRAYTGYKLELHISNPHLRETFRHISYVSPAADGIVAGLGVNGYELAVEMLPDLIRQTN